MCVCVCVFVCLCVCVFVCLCVVGVVLRFFFFCVCCCFFCVCVCFVRFFIMALFSAFYRGSGRFATRIKLGRPSFSLRLASMAKPVAQVHIRS